MINKWIPRVLAILFAILISMFAFDASGFLDLLMQLIPAYIVILGIGLGWRRPKAGATVFFIACILLIPFMLKTPATGIIIAMTFVQGLLFWFTKQNKNILPQ